jgi:hypothetical protein
MRKEMPTRPMTTVRMVLTRPLPGKPRSKLPPKPRPEFCGAYE